MRPLMYRQRPAYPALVGAIVSLFAGILSVAVIYRRVERGEMSEERLIFIISLTCLMTGIFLIVAFARYQYTHLWLKDRPKKNR